MMTIFAYIGIICSALFILLIVAAILYIADLPEPTERRPIRPNVKR